MTYNEQETSRYILFLYENKIQFGPANWSQPSLGFVSNLREALGVQGRGRMVHKTAGDTFQLREAITAYSSNGSQSAPWPKDNESEINLIPWDI